MRSGSSSRRLRLAVLALALAALALPAAAGASHHPRRAPQHRAGDIVVHGRWTITVRTPGGALVHRYRFENKYVGGPFLANILARQSGVGFWFVDLIGSACGLDAYCGVTEPGWPSSPGNLTVTVSGYDLVLQGTLSAPADDTISQVDTGNLLCPPSIAPATATPVTCADAPGAPGSVTFTRKSGLNVSVKAKQQIDVKVDLSFS